MPDSVEMPAPVKATIRWLASSSERRRSISAGVALGMGLVLRLGLGAGRLLAQLERLAAAPARTGGARGDVADVAAIVEMVGNTAHDRVDRKDFERPSRTTPAVDF